MKAKLMMTLLLFYGCVYAQNNKSTKVEFTFEKEYETKLAKANNSEQRGVVLAAYLDTVIASTLTEEKKIELCLVKVKAMIAIDFYGWYEGFTKAKSQNTMFIIQKISKNLPEEQHKATMAIAQYITAKFSYEYGNNKAGVMPEYPANAPKPGQGWNEFFSKVKIEPPKENLVQANETKPIIIPAYAISDREAQSYTGKYYKYQKSTKAPGSTYEKIENFAFKVVEVYKDKTTYKPMFRIKWTSLDNTCKATEEKHDAELIITEINQGYYSEWNGYYSCSACGGRGTWVGSTSHTSDYTYTLGAKITTYSTSKASCNKCSGSGRSGVTKAYAIQCLDY